MIREWKGWVGCLSVGWIDKLLEKNQPVLSINIR